MPNPSKFSRRRALQGAAAAGGAVFAPQVLTGQQGGRRFKAFVRYKTGAQVEELRLTPLGPRDVVVRTEASGVCYTIVAGTLATTNVARPNIPNHSGMGIVDEVGSQVQRVKKGDRVGVLGLGGLGHMAVKFASSFGAEVTMLSGSPFSKALRY